MLLLKDYCAKHSPCLNNGTCVDSGKHSFKCLCEIGYSGDICDTYETTTGFLTI
jgi:hypothetical protein